jgi:hypothetical protein
VCEKRGLRAVELLNFAAPEIDDYREKEPERDQNGAEKARCGGRQCGEKHSRDTQQNDRAVHAVDTLHVD